MSEHSNESDVTKFRSKELDICPLRETLRQEFPKGPDGIVIEDIDVAIRRHGPSYNLDSRGDLILFEKKTGNEEWKKYGGQWYLYDFIDKAISSSQNKDRWRGYHLVRLEYTIYPCKCPTCLRPIQNAKFAYEQMKTAIIYVDDVQVTYEEFLSFVESGDKNLDRILDDRNIPDE